MFVLQGGEHMNKLLKDLYDCFYTPPELAEILRRWESALYNEKICGRI